MLRATKYLSQVDGCSFQSDSISHRHLFMNRKVWIIMWVNFTLVLIFLFFMSEFFAVADDNGDIQAEDPRKCAFLNCSKRDQCISRKFWCKNPPCPSMLYCSKNRGETLQGPPSCDVVRCSKGSICVVKVRHCNWDSGCRYRIARCISGKEYVDGPTSCAGFHCRKGFRCILRESLCLKPPCKLLRICGRIDEVETWFEVCKNIGCASEYECFMRRLVVNCIQPPCSHVPDCLKTKESGAKVNEYCEGWVCPPTEECSVHIEEPCSEDNCRIERSCHGNLLNPINDTGRYRIDASGSSFISGQRKQVTNEAPPQESKKLRVISPMPVIATYDPNYRPYKLAADDAALINKNRNVPCYNEEDCKDSVPHDSSSAKKQLIEDRSQIDLKQQWNMNAHNDDRNAVNGSFSRDPRRDRFQDTQQTQEKRDTGNSHRPDESLFLPTTRPWSIWSRGFSLRPRIPEVILHDPELLYLHLLYLEQMNANGWPVPPRILLQLLRTILRRQINKKSTSGIPSPINSFTVRPKNIHVKTTTSPHLNKADVEEKPIVDDHLLKMVSDKELRLYATHFRRDFDSLIKIIQELIKIIGSSRTSESSGMNTKNGEIFNTVKQKIGKNNGSNALKDDVFELFVKALLGCLTFDFSKNTNKINKDDCETTTKPEEQQPINFQRYFVELDRGNVKNANDFDRPVGEYQVILNLKGYVEDGKQKGSPHWSKIPTIQNITLRNIRYGKDSAGHLEAESSMEFPVFMEHLKKLKTENPGKVDLENESAHLEFLNNVTRIIAKNLIYVYNQSRDEHSPPKLIGHTLVFGNGTNPGGNGYENKEPEDSGGTDYDDDLDYDDDDYDNDEEYEDYSNSSEIAAASNRTEIFVNSTAKLQNKSNK